MAKLSKKVQIKIKKDVSSFVIVNEGWTCIDGNYIIKNEYVEFDDTLLNSKIASGESVKHDKINHVYSFECLPPLTQLVPAIGSLSHVINTNLLHVMPLHNARVFYNQDQKHFTLLNDNYYKMIDKTEMNSGEWRQTAGKFGGLALIYNDVIIGYFMPIDSKSFYLDKIDCLAPDHKLQYEDIKEYLIK